MQQDSLGQPERANSEKNDNKKIATRELIEDVVAAQQGCLFAFERLVNSSSKVVVSIALSVVRDADACEDIAQEVYIHCWNNLTMLNNSHSFLPWLRQSTKHIALNYLRKQKNKLKVGGEQAEQILEQFNSTHGLPEHNLNIIEQKQLITHLLDILPEDTRDTVTLYYREQQSTPVVAELLGISESSVRKRLSRARIVMKEEVLNKFGNALLTATPTISFTTLGLSSLVYAPKASAGAVAASTTGWSKLLAILGGAAFGAVSSVIAIFWSHDIVRQRVSNDKIKRQLQQLKYASSVWVIFCLALLILTFHFTTGVWAPILMYGVFAIGFYMLTTHSQRLIHWDMAHNPELDEQKTTLHKQRFWGTLGVVVGITSSVIATLFGLYAAGL